MSWQVLALFREINLSYSTGVQNYLRFVDQVTAFPASFVSLDCSLPRCGAVPGPQLVPYDVRAHHCL